MRWAPARQRSALGDFGESYVTLSVETPEWTFVADRWIAGALVFDGIAGDLADGGGVNLVIFADGTGGDFAGSGGFIANQTVPSSVPEPGVLGLLLTGLLVGATGIVRRVE